MFFGVQNRSFNLYDFAYNEELNASVGTISTNRLND